MSNRARTVLTLPFCLLCALPVFGQDAGEDVSILKPDKAAESQAKDASATADTAAADDGSDRDVDISVGTKLYDPESVEELFNEYKAENERRAQEMAPHLNSESLEIIELAPVQVDPYHIRNFDMLLDKIDPRPRQRLERLAELDPQAAAELQVSMRAEERFFAGENEVGYDMNAGRVAEVDFRKIGASVSEAVKRAKQAMRDKKMTDDQESLPVDED